LLYRLKVLSPSPAVLGGRLGGTCENIPLFLLLVNSLA
jgi:hypothetical protein